MPHIRPVLLALPLALLPALACGRAPAPIAPAAAAVSPRPPEVTAESIRLGQAVYNGRGNCRYCHGTAGQGGPLGPNLADSIWITGDGSYRALVQQVMHGSTTPRDSTRLPMPEHEVTDLRYPDISAVAAYVWSLREHRP